MRAAGGGPCGPSGSPAPGIHKGAGTGEWPADIIGTVAPRRTKQFLIVENAFCFSKDRYSVERT